MKALITVAFLALTLAACDRGPSADEIGKAVVNAKNTDDARKARSEVAREAELARQTDIAFCEQFGDPAFISLRGLARFHEVFGREPQPPTTEQESRYVRMFGEYPALPTVVEPVWTPTPRPYVIYHPSRTPTPQEAAAEIARKYGAGR